MGSKLKFALTSFFTIIMFSVFLSLISCGDDHNNEESSLSSEEMAQPTDPVKVKRCSGKLTGPPVYAYGKNKHVALGDKCSVLAKDGRSDLCQLQPKRAVRTSSPCTCEFSDGSTKLGRTTRILGTNFQC